MSRTQQTTLAVLGFFLLTACATGNGDAADEAVPQEQTEPADTTPDTAAPEDAEMPEGADETQTGPQDGTASLDDAVETITYPMQGYVGEITMGLLTPEVEGETLLVSIVFEPEFADDTEAVAFSELHGEPTSVLAPVVSDRENLKVYNVPRESTNQFTQGGGWFGGSIGSGVWASAIGDVEVRSGEQYVHWAYFPAPEDDIDTVDISVIPGAQEFRAVQIDWGDTEPGAGDTTETPEDDDDA